MFYLVAGKKEGTQTSGQRRRLRSNPCRPNHRQAPPPPAAAAAVPENYLVTVGSKAPNPMMNIGRGGPHVHHEKGRLQLLQRNDTDWDTPLEGCWFLRGRGGAVEEILAI